VSLGCLARNGHQVIGVDLDPTKVAFINSGRPTIVEKGIDEIISSQHQKGNISATDDSVYAVRQTDVSFICVGTPSTPNGHLDHGSVLRVAEQIGQGIAEKEGFHIVVIRSTVFPGTNKKVTEIIANSSGRKVNEDFAVVSNPEFLREGSAVSDYYNPAFTLIGTDHKAVADAFEEIYAGISCPTVITEVKTAEMLKYVNNAFHALKITFANEIGNICKKLEIDSHKLMEIFCMDIKLNLSPYYLKPGFAYGGSCLPKDLRALRTIAHDYYLECPVIESIDKSNELQKKTVLDQILKLGKERIGVLGLSFKAGTDDLRNSPVVDIIEQLLGKGFEIRIYDKNVHFSQLRGANKEYIISRIPFISKFIVPDLRTVIEKSDVLVVVNREDEFQLALSSVNPSQIIYDLVKIDSLADRSVDNYIGIAW
jgi:GDP-mannose 6-dehydrogenase